jgi:hypothetical protein
MLRGLDGIEGMHDAVSWLATVLVCFWLCLAKGVTMVHLTAALIHGDLKVVGDHRAAVENYGNDGHLITLRQVYDEL